MLAWSVLLSLCRTASPFGRICGSSLRGRLRWSGSVAGDVAVVYMVNCVVVYDWSGTLVVASDAQMIDATGETVAAGDGVVSTDRRVRCRLVRSSFECWFDTPCDFCRYGHGHGAELM